MHDPIGKNMCCRHLKITLFLLFLYSSLVANGQATDNMLCYKNISSDRYFRINYENDVFIGTDIYYTQGIFVELVKPWVKDLPFTKLLAHPHYNFNRYGIGIEHNGYTPTSISNNTILYGDRPFAACVFLKTFQIATDSERQQRFASALSAGIIGQGAGGMGMQTNVHRWLHNAAPQGWEYQVCNDAILNYQVDYEKQLFAYRNLFLLAADAIARIGTLSDKAGFGGTVMLGYFDSPFTVTDSARNKPGIYVYDHLQADVVGYDATMEGGLFNRKSPYTISPADISRITFQNRFGLVVSYRRIYFEYFLSFLSKEFQTGGYHAWGGMQVAFGL
jgi:lipid A 3-O-deacylase